MIRQTIIPTANAYTIKIPDEWIGESVTIVYDKGYIEFEYETSIELVTKYLDKPSDLFADCRVDLSNFTFDRDEANNYE